MNTSDIISLIALILSLFAMIHSTYKSSELAAKRKGNNIVEISYYEKNDMKQLYIFQRKNEPAAIYVYENYILIKNDESKIGMFIDMNNIQEIKYN